MKVTVTRYLNVRVGKPSVNAPCYQYLAPGSEIEVEEKIFQGDWYEGNNEWYRNIADNYYWSGGLQIQKSDTPLSITAQPFDKSKFWWLSDFNISDLWSRGLTGRGIRIAVLDSGLAIPHPDLIIEQAHTRDLTNSTSGILDNVGHGTHVTGIIKGSNNGFGITGLAFNSDFFFGKITHDIFGDSIDYLALGIDWALQQKVDIISISAGFEASKKNLQDAIKLASDRHILVVCASGNKDGTNGPDILYPARYKTDSTLSVGGTTRGLLPLPDSINVPQTEIFAPGEAILSTYVKSGYAPLSGSSQAVPFVAAVACLILEHRRSDNPTFKASELKRELIATATPASFGKIINPLNLIGI
ncbi:MAG: S8 family serine peptidase [Cyclobacteriaceae bacterium]